MRNLLVLLLLVLSPLAASAQFIKGHVALCDSLDGSYTTIYVPAVGVTAVANGDGDYLVRGLTPGKYEVEYSHLGYQTLKKVVTVEDNKFTYTDVVLELQPVQLSSAFVLPNNQDPAQYILKKMNEKAAANKKKVAFTADIAYDMEGHNMDFVAGFLPKFLKNTLIAAAKVAGVGAVIRTAFDNTDFKVAAGLHRVYKNKKKTDSNQHIISSNIELDAAQKKGFQKADVFLEENLFDDVYITEVPWASKKKQKKFTYAGSYEENGKDVFILKYSSGKKDNAEVHIVDGEWGILKAEITSTGSIERINCRKVNGIYMPVGLNHSMTVGMLDAKEIEKWIENAKKMEENPDGVKMTMIERNMTKRLIKQVGKLEQAKAKGKPIEISVDFNYSVKYAK